jgi:hypothetical protein
LTTLRRRQDSIDHLRRPQISNFGATKEVKVVQQDGDGLGLSRAIQ